MELTEASIDRSTLFVSIGCLVASVLLTGVVRRLLLARRLLAIPNERSSHDVPTPLGGGVAIVLVTTVATCVLTALDIVAVETLIALSGGAAVAIVGFLDDRRHVSPKLRIAVHFAAALWGLLWLGGLPPVPFGFGLVALGWVGYVLGALGIVWSLNLFNFMDGIDGIAASEAAVVALAGALICVAIGTSEEVPALALALGCASAGFLVWNWPPAKIFMGDVGSGYLGYTIALIVVIAAREHAVAWIVWLILGAVFFVDATLTLLRRSARRERVFEAHRSHAYQWLARRWGHRRVTVTVLVVNVAWLFPWAFVAATYPDYAAWITLVAVLPVVAAAIIAGAGPNDEYARTDERPRGRV